MPEPFKLPSRNSGGNNRPMRPLTAKRPASAHPNFFLSPSMLSRPADFYSGRNLFQFMSSPKKEFTGVDVNGENTIESVDVPVHSYLKELPGQQKPH